MATERRTAAQAEQQQVVLDYVANGGCNVVGLRNTRLGDDAAKMNRVARGVMGRISDEQRRRDSAGLSEEQCAVAMAQRSSTSFSRQRELRLKGLVDCHTINNYRRWRRSPQIEAIETHFLL